MIGPVKISFTDSENKVVRINLTYKVNVCKS